ncbi:sugar phosphate isomerase/epimerase family protein [Clostridium cellulovorans]|uniref:Xylose isomerase domain-containing protein TIM barrel n=1 Tax=Clostridium cellulovorans (strain ATCC 35296 / DSM 3052 / OCM 3 / 743B) TaxID=573061 RepID=D9STY4_CLOC7|nr:TIM barrel protein [Clostridium cellulovorans]ADL50822.1 Xylose isomerase domain-containing protein TIM barrel [Clostridium cellulovorans 743B]
MKEIVLCDDGEYLRVAKLCEKFNVNVNIDAFNDPEFFNNNPNEIEKQLKIYKNTKVSSIHGTFTDLCFGSKDSLIREVAKKRFEYSYEISRKLGCKHIVLHHGYVPGTSYPPNWVKRSKIFWDDFLRDKDEETVFHIENLLEHTPDLISEIVSTVDDKRLNICLDVGHANCNSKTSVLEWIKKLNKQIGFVHLHNNYGEQDEHSGFEKGTIDFLEICNALEDYAPNAIWGIETNIDDMEDSIKWLIENKYLN